MPTEWNHPRRAAKETIAYLCQMETIIDSFPAGGIAPENDEDDQAEDLSPHQVLQNVVNELTHCTASVMEDKKGSVVVEKLARFATTHQLRVLLHRCLGYCLSLFNNRYSSHALQTMLSLVGPIVDAEEQGGGSVRAAEPEVEGEVGDEVAPLMRDTIVAMAHEVGVAWEELFRDMSGSHSARALLQVLAGLPILAERRGKNSRHTHSIETAAPRGTASTTIPEESSPSTWAQLQVDAEAATKWGCGDQRWRVPVEFTGCLGAACEVLSTLPSRSLQSLAVCSCGCPALVTLIRVSAALESTEDTPVLSAESAAMRLIHTTLEWSDAPACVEIVYGMAGEKSGSHFLEAAMWLAPQSFAEEMCERLKLEDTSVMMEYAGDQVANFFIQSALQRIDDVELATKLITSVASLAKNILEKKRGGVLWRAAQTCIRTCASVSTQKCLITAVASAVMHNTCTNEDTSVSFENMDAYTSAKMWVPALINLKLKGSEEGSEESSAARQQMTFDVPLARLVENVLRFDSELSMPVAKAIIALPEETLVAIASSGVSCLCLLDPLFTNVFTSAESSGGKKGKKTEHKSAASSPSEALLRRLRGHLPSLAKDRSGSHLLLKLWRATDLKGKKNIASEISEAGSLLATAAQAHPGGRAVMSECMIERFSRDPAEWEEALSRRASRAALLSSIIQDQEQPPAETVTNNTDSNTAKGRKRTRNRARGGANPAEGAEHEQETSVSEGKHSDLSFIREAISASTSKEGTVGGEKKAKKRKRVPEEESSSMQIDTEPSIDKSQSVESKKSKTKKVNPQAGEEVESISEKAKKRKSAPENDNSMQIDTDSKIKNTDVKKSKVKVVKTQVEEIAESANTGASEGGEKKAAKRPRGKRGKKSGGDGFKMFS